MQAANLIAHKIDTKAQVVLDSGTITDIYLFTWVKLTPFPKSNFTYAQDAKENCPISKVLKAANIHLDVELG